MNITKCPTAYAYGSNSKQGTSVSDADRQALQEHYSRKDKRSEAARERAHRTQLWEYSTRTQKQTP
jgi:hypothetical protein